MIIIFGGTTEGRVAARVCDKAAKRFIYSTKGEEQSITTSYAQHITGDMDVDQMVRTIMKGEVKLIVDAAHPHAVALHNNIWRAAEICDIPTIRFERIYPKIEYHKVKYFNSLAQVVEYIDSEGLRNILALTGVKSASQLAKIATSNSVILRIMDRQSSHHEVVRSTFPNENIVYYDLDSTTATQKNSELCQRLGIEHIITKDSGLSGGFETKIELAKELDLSVFIIKRPPLPHFTTTIYGEFGLRRAIERLLPSFFELHTGFTTGSAATAASVAALDALVNDNINESIEILLPNGEPIIIPTQITSIEADQAVCQVIKDGGDDPDATHKIEIIAKVRLLDGTTSQINIRGGRGVGKVTLPGIGIEVGEAAINPTPLEMIRQNIAKIADEAAIKNSIDIEIEVPRGEEIGAKTFNPRLGIKGGISILGTSGIVQPFSSQAFLESITRQIEIVKAIGLRSIAINSGAMSERYIKAYTPDLPQQCYIHYGNLIGATIELASREGIEHIYIGCMIGKAVKLAKGTMDTHSKSSVIDRDFILRLANEAQCSIATKEQIKSITTARQLWDIVPHNEHKLFELIAQYCFDHCKPLFPNGTLELLLIGEAGDIEVIIK